MYRRNHTPVGLTITIGPLMTPRLNPDPATNTSSRHKTGPATARA